MTFASIWKRHTSDRFVPSGRYHLLVKAWRHRPDNSIVMSEVGIPLCEFGADAEIATKLWPDSIGPNNCPECDRLVWRIDHVAQLIGKALASVVKPHRLPEEA